MEKDFLLRSAEQFLREVLELVLQLEAEGAGTEIIGSVPGRPETEDMEIGVDRDCENLFLNIVLDGCRKQGIRLGVYSEHGTYGDDDAEYLAAVDPFDGSGLFQRGIPACWWSVFTIFDRSRTPLIGAAVDILSRRLYLAVDGEVHRIDLLPSGKERKTVLSSVGRSNLDLDTKIAAYVMNRDYRRTWTKWAERLFDKRPGMFLWTNGGSCIYPWLAEGAVDAYLMPDEPRSEIDPGLGFAEATGLALCEIKEDGMLTPYHFKPELFSTGRVTRFIAASTMELAEAIVQELMV